MENVDAWSDEGVRRPRAITRGLMISALVVGSFGACASAATAGTTLSSRDQATAFQIDSAHDGVQSADSLRPPLERRWAVTLPLPQTNPQVSFPVIADGRAFVTAWSYGGSNYAYALNLATGAIDWGPVAIGPSGHFSSLTFDDGRLFVTDSDGDLVALDPDTGAELWADSGVATGDVPTAADGTLYTGPGLQAFNETNGRLLWSSGLAASFGTGMPAVSNGTIYTAGEDDNLFAFTSSGTERWQYQGPDSGTVPVIPVVAGQSVYVRTPTAAYQSAYPGWIHSTATGSQIGTFNSLTVPAVDRSQAYETPGVSPSGQPPTHVTLDAVSRQSGDIAWTFAGDHSLDSAPVEANGIIYEGSGAGHLYALSAATGKKVWSASLGASVPESNETNKTGPVSGLSIGGGYLVVPTMLNGETAGPTVSAYASVGPAGTLNATAANFQKVAAGSSGTPATLTLTNTGSAPLAVRQVALSGSGAAAFPLTSDSCSETTLVPGATCTVSVGFTPPSAGTFTATLDIPGSDPSPHVIQLTGTGTP